MRVTPARFIVLLLLLELVVLTYCQAGGLRIISQYRAAAVVNGVLVQNNTITVQCTDADFDITRYLQISQADGSTRLLGVRCNTPKYTFSKTLVGYIPADGAALLYSNCLIQSPYGFDPSLLASVDFSRIPSNPGQIVALSHLKRKQVEIHRPDAFAYAYDAKTGTVSKNKVDKHRKFFGALLGGVVGGAIYCAIAGCGGGGGADPAKLAQMNTQIGRLQQTSDNLVATTNAMAGNLATLFTAQSQFATQIAASQNTSLQLFQEQQRQAQLQYDYQRNTTSYLGYLNGKLEDDITGLQVHLEATQTQVGDLQAAVIEGFNVSAGNLAAVVRDLSYVSGNLTLRINENALGVAQKLGYLRSLVTQISSNTQAQITQINDLIRNSQPRRALAKFTQDQLTNIINSGLTPFLANLGTPPAADSNEFVWKMNVETSRVMYVRDNSGLTAQQLDVAWYCNTRKFIDFGSSVTSFIDILRYFGPNFCNATLAGNCTCWATTQRYSCATNNTMVVTSDWLNKTDIRDSNICTSAVTTGTKVAHVTFDSLLVVLDAVCNDGTYNNSNLRVLSGQMGRSVSVPYNALACGMVYDTFMDVTTTGLNFPYAIVYLVTLSFAKVYEASDSYAKFIYGVIPDGVTTKEDPLAVINGTDARCFYSSFMSFDGVNPMLPVYKLTFVSTTASVTITLDNSTFNTITQVTQAVPNDIVLPPTDSVVVGDPADPSVLYNVPYSELSIAPAAAARCGHVTYAMIDHPDNFTIGKWNSANRDVFDHFCATNVASYYKHTLNGQGLCTGTALIGEGAQCTIHQNFLVSSVPGGVVYEPQPGTGPTVIVGFPVPDGNITSLIFSDCPSISLAQTAPNVATLTLGNPRPDGDITVAIVLGGECAQTVPSFTITKNTARDFLIPVCLGKTSSERTISVLRYDSLGDLVPCGNTTTFTVDRATYLNSFTTPDVIQVNVTTQISLDSNQIALQRSQNQIRDIMGDFMLVFVQDRIAQGLPPALSTLTSFDSLFTRLYSNAQTTAQLINETRNTQLYNYTAGFDAYGATQAFYLAQLNASINAQRNLLETYRNQTFNDTSLAAYLANLTITTNAGVAAWAAAVALNENQTLAIIHATFDALNSIQSTGGLGLGGFFSTVGGFLLDDVLKPGVAELKGAIAFVAKAAVGVVNFAADLVKTGLNGLLGLAGDAFKIIFIGLMVVAGLAVIFMLGGGGSMVTSPQLRKVLTNKLETRDLDDVRPKPVQPSAAQEAHPAVESAKAAVSNATGIDVKEVDKAQAWAEIMGSSSVQVATGARPFDPKNEQRRLLRMAHDTYSDLADESQNDRRKANLSSVVIRNVSRKVPKDDL